MKNDVEIYLEVLAAELHLYTQTALADFFEVKQPTLFGWIQRNSVKTLRKYIKNKGLDVEKIDEAVKSKQKANNEPLTMADVRAHIKNKDHHIKLHDNIQKVLEYQAAKTPYTSPYSELFQILMTENKDAIFQILTDKLVLENVDDGTKMKFIEDFEALIKHVVSPATKLKMLERLRAKCI